MVATPPLQQWIGLPLLPPPPLAPSIQGGGIGVWAWLLLSGAGMLGSGLCVV